MTIHFDPGFLETAFIVITGVATSIIATPIFYRGLISIKVMRWKKEMQPKNGKNEDDNKNVYVCKKAIDYFSERWDTHEVIDKISVEAENDGKALRDKINSNGDIITVKFELFERFVKGPYEKLQRGLLCRMVDRIL